VLIFSDVTLPSVIATVVTELDPISFDVIPPDATESFPDETERVVPMIAEDVIVL
jgi:hypothetical protein